MLAKFPHLSKPVFYAIALTLLLPSTAVMVGTEYQLLAASRGLDTTHLFALWSLLSLALGWISFYGLSRTTGLPHYARVLDIALLIATAGQLLPILKALSTQPPLEVWLIFIWPTLSTWFFHVVIQRGGLKHAPAY
ncbi:hypothetical protein [Pseudomonas abietaniphila]|uniref:hypothetical protein n=1 Tax=Pseudomonas abietaniphila TaxID=89065 RepID=UPI000781041C|nr:hypothetical protein [Pseudomonas abietaniphila]